jgi:hypothetical protein
MIALGSSPTWRPEATGPDADVTTAAASSVVAKILIRFI